MNAAEEALAHCQIESLLSAYFQALDRGDLQALESDVLAEDATWDVVGLTSSGRTTHKVESRARILAWLQQLTSGDDASSEGSIRHFVGTHVIRIDPGGRVARSTSHLLAVDTETMSNRVNGFVEAEHVRTGEGWRIRYYKVEERITDEDMQDLQGTLGRGQSG